jgi:predicted MFS family arabinose efflux permease
VTNSLSPILWCGMGFALISAIFSRCMLPTVTKTADEMNQRGLAPTWAALRSLWKPCWWPFTLGLMLATVFGSTYHAFFPIYLSDHLRLDHSLVPYVINLGVLLEIGYTLIIPWWQRRWGLTSLIIGGVVCMTLRLFLLSHFPSWQMSLLVQVIHGWEIMALFVAPVMVFNTLADDHFRSSIQGAFAMMMGLSRILGNLWGGYFVEKDIYHAYQLAGYGGLVAIIIVIIGCHRLRKNSAIRRSEAAG